MKKNFNAKFQYFSNDLTRSHIHTTLKIHSVGIRFLYSSQKLILPQKITYADSLQKLRKHILDGENTDYFSSNFSEFFKPLPTPPKTQDNQQEVNIL